MFKINLHLLNIIIYILASFLLSVLIVNFRLVVEISLILKYAFVYQSGASYILGRIAESAQQASLNDQIISQLLKALTNNLNHISAISVDVAVVVTFSTVLYFFMPKKNVTLNFFFYLIVFNFFLTTYYSFLWNYILVDSIVIFSYVHTLCFY